LLLTPFVERKSFPPFSSYISLIPSFDAPGLLASVSPSPVSPQIASGTLPKFSAPSLRPPPPYILLSASLLILRETPDSYQGFFKTRFFGCPVSVFSNPLLLRGFVSIHFLPVLIDSPPFCLCVPLERFPQLMPADRSPLTQVIFPV